jgi:hypothetical protein
VKTRRQEIFTPFRSVFGEARNISPVPLWRGISPGVKAVGVLGSRPTTLVVPNVKKIRDLNLPGTPWATSACCERYLPLPFTSLETSYKLRRCVCTPLPEDPCSKCTTVLFGSFWYLVTASRSNTVLYEDKVQTER